VKIVRAVLADGSVKEYRYERNRTRPRVSGGILQAIFNQYSVSPEFGAMAGGTRENFLRHMRALQDEFAWMTEGDLEDRSARVEFYAYRDRLKDTPFKADDRIGVLRTALYWAEDRGIIGVNRAARIKMLSRQLGLDKKHRDKCYTEAQEVRILSGPQHLADLYTVGLFTCLRRVDCCAIDSRPLSEGGHFDDDGWLVIKPQKTARSSGVVLHLPVFAIPALAAVINRLRKANPQGKLLRTETGIPWQITNVSRQWRAELDEMGMSNMRFHDVRHTGNTRLGIVGCTDSERGAINGDKMAEGSGALYVARMREISLNAYMKWKDYLARKPVVVSLEKERGKRKAFSSVTD
jgi:integrase